MQLTVSPAPVPFLVLTAQILTSLRHGEPGSLGGDVQELGFWPTVPGTARCRVQRLRRPAEKIEASLTTNL